MAYTLAAKKYLSDKCYICKKRFAEGDEIIFLTNIDMAHRSCFRNAGCSDSQTDTKQTQARR